MQNNKIELYLSSFLIIAVFALFIVFPNQSYNVLFHIKDSFISNYGYIFTWSALLFIIMELIVVFTKIGNIRVGSNKPEYGNISYWSMIFSNGMGVSIIFWAVLEPLYHKGEGMNMSDNMISTFHNWGYGAWATYGIIAVAFSYLYYIAKNDKPIDKLFNIKILNSLSLISICISTVAGLTLSFIYTVDILKSGAEEFLNIKVDGYSIIASITLCTIVSAVLGIERGIKKVSLLNVAVAVLLCIFTFLFQDTVKLLVDAIYLTAVYTLKEIPLLMEYGNTPEKAKYLADWSYSYYAAWISWGLFVGIFISKISKGRTLREIVIGAVVIPTILSTFWFTVFGESSLMNSSENIYELMKTMPLSNITCITILLSTVLFFITGHDSAGIVLEEITVKNTKIYWISIMGLLAIILVSLGGNVVESARILNTLATIPVLFIIYVVIYRFIVSYKTIKFK